MKTDNPYRHLPGKAFWRSAVAERHFSDMADLSQPIDLRPTDKIATAGSCFAQHIGRALRDRGANYIDLEVAPPDLSSEEALAHGFGVYSCRYGNLYTVRQLLQLAKEATEQFAPEETIWKKRERFFDAMRPSVDPVGHADSETVTNLRRTHLKNVLRMFTELDVFVFTLGLTEAWTSASGKTVFASCPGTVAGEYDKSKYQFKNFTHAEIVSDFRAFHDILMGLNPRARIILTVSPVSLAATASDDHVLIANTYSKSTLRSAAGELTSSMPNVHYFPSFEIITTHVNRGSFYDPDMRNVNIFGVNHVMEHFFASLPFQYANTQQDNAADANNAIICDEEKLADFQP